MAQKILSSSLRLNKTKEWNTSNIISYKNNDQFYSIEYEIKKYLFSFFNKRKIIITNIRIKNILTDIKVFIFIRIKSKLKKKINKNIYSFFLIKKNLEQRLNNFLKFNFNTKLYIIRLNSLFLNRKSKDRYFYKNLYNCLQEPINKIWVKRRSWKRLFPFFNLAVLTKNPYLLCFFMFRTIRRKKHGHKKVFYHDVLPKIILLPIFYNLKG